MGKTESRREVKKLFPLILLLSGCMSVQTISDQDRSFQKMKRLAMVGMRPVSGTRPCDKFADEAFGNLEQGFMLEGYTLVDRSMLDAILKEQKLGATGAVDPRQAVSIGKILGVQGMVIPYCEQSQSVFYRLKIVNVETGEIVINSALSGRWPASVGIARKWIRRIKSGEK